MTTGNVEANLMYFIYTEAIPMGGATEIVETRKGDSSKEAEAGFRNRNLEAIEQARLEKGVSSLHSETKPLDFTELSEMFNLQRVGS